MKTMTDVGFQRLTAAIIENAVDDWKSSYIYLMKRVGKINKLETVMKQYKRTHGVVEKTKKFYDADRFLRSEDFRNYAIAIDLTVSYDRLRAELIERCNDEIFKTE